MTSNPGVVYWLHLGEELSVRPLVQGFFKTDAGGPDDCLRECQAPACPLKFEEPLLL